MKGALRRRAAATSMSWVWRGGQLLIPLCIEVGDSQGNETNRKSEQAKRSSDWNALPIDFNAAEARNDANESNERAKVAERRQNDRCADRCSDQRCSDQSSTAAHKSHAHAARRNRDNRCQRCPEAHAKISASRSGT